MIPDSKQEPHRQKEYIITEYQLQIILERRGALYISCQGKFREEIVDKVRSRTHSAAPVPDERQCLCDACQMTVRECVGKSEPAHHEKIAQQAKKKERERVINAFIEKAKGRIETMAPDHGIHLGWVLLSEVDRCLESLRQSKGGEQP